MMYTDKKQEKNKKWILQGQISGAYDFLWVSTVVVCVCLD